MGAEKLEPVFIAGNVAEVDIAEKLLDNAGIAYEVTIEADVKTISGNVCLNGVLFQVRPSDADGSRQLFRDQGLEQGIVAR